MLTLGIHDGHTATACLFEDGQVIACISEERLTRKKDCDGFPEQSIKMCLAIAGRTPDKIDAVGCCSLMPQTGIKGYYSPSLSKKMFSYATPFVPKRVLQSARGIPVIHHLARVIFKNRITDTTQKIRAMGIQTPSIDFFDHHLLHAATTYHASWFKDRKTLIITLDGSGDAICATINIGDGGKIERLKEIFNYNSICDFYTRVTQHLGMKPMSHEYKVMGMAPYATDYNMKETKKRFGSYFGISPRDPLRIINTSGTWKWQFAHKLEKDLRGVRFDTVSAAAQGLFNDVVVAWVRNAIHETGIRNVALSGGGFMNVKVNYSISQLPEVDSLFVFPSCGDESNPIGACILAALKKGMPASEVKTLGMNYWGPQFSHAQIEAELEHSLNGTSGLTIKRHEQINQVVAERIADGKIVGRFTGRMEWGARALGNRSIVADARREQVIHQLNKAIKMRDFWMPFAPAVLIDYRDRYLTMREDYRSPFMTLAVDSKEPAWDAIPACIHPFDKTARAQILDPEHHPSFYDLVSRYEKLTGVGAVLNTSFNLHGDPIVCSPADAIRSFLNSGLDVLQLEGYLVDKTGGGMASTHTEPQQDSKGARKAAGEPTVHVTSGRALLRQKA